MSLCFCIFLLSCWLLFETDAAFAQNALCDDPNTPIHEQCTSTPGPTATWEPLYKTPTPIPTDYYDCPPGGLPANWGTVTPDTFWMSQCYNCLATGSPVASTTPLPTTTIQATLTAAALGTQYPNGTPTLTPSPSASPSPTVTPSGPHYYAVNYGYSYQGNWSGRNQWINVGPLPVSFGSPITFPDTPAGVVVTYARAIGGASGSRVDFDFNNNSFFGFNVGGSLIDSGKGVGCWYRNGGHPRGAGACTETGYISKGVLPYMSPSAVAGATMPVQIGSISALCYPTECTLSLNVVLLSVIYYGTHEPMPTPTPTALPTMTATPNGSYCGEATGTTSGGGYGENPYTDMLPEITLGPSECRDFPAFEADISALSWIPGMSGYSTLVYPGLRLCTRMVDFGDFRLFGLKFDLDAVAFIAMAAFLVRIFMRS